MNRALQVALVVKNLPASVGDERVAGSVPGLGRCPGGGHGNSTPAFLPGESQGPRSLMGYSPQGHKESDTTEATGDTRVEEQSIFWDPAPGTFLPHTCPSLSHDIRTRQDTSCPHCLARALYSTWKASLSHAHCWVNSILSISLCYRVHYTFHQTLAHLYHCMWAVLFPCSVYISSLRLSFLRAEMHSLAQSYMFFGQKMKPTLELPCWWVET